MEIRYNRLYCNRENDFELFFSITDYLNSFFTSNNPEDIIKFYSFFRDRDSLIKWMKDRPKGHYDIIEVEGNKDIIVVIPTADFNGKFAKACRDDIFKGLHMIFVQSGGREDYYFNYAHNCNAGIKKAMEYNPKWIVLSNDDMYKIDDVEVLKNELRKLNHENIDVVLLDPPKKLIIGKPTIIRTILYFIYNKNLRNKIRIEKYFKKKFKLNNYYTIIGGDGLDVILFKYLYTFLPVGYYGYLFIFSSKMLKNYSANLFDETYINGSEEADLNF
ncbi:MAG: hypothetical protein RXO36_08165, partial [Candidatus Nanopusillus acidilobi]